MSDKDIYHTLTATIGVRAIRDSNGIIKRVACTDAWATKPGWVPRDMELVEIEIEIPASLFGGTIPRAKGKLQSILIEEFEATVRMLED